MKKGFTLIELLAVIVILAIIALIAVPQVLNVIEASKVKSMKSSAYGIIKSVENEIAVSAMSSDDIEGVYTVSGDTLTNGSNDIEFKGGTFESGEVAVATEDNIGVALYEDGYCTKGNLESLITFETIASKCVLDKGSMKIHTFGGSQSDYLFNLHALDNGNYYISGTTKSNDFIFNGLNNGGDNLNSDGYYVELDKNFDFVRAITFGESEGESAFQSRKVSDGYILGGSTEASGGIYGTTNQGGYDLYLSKFDDNLTFEWARMYGDSGFNGINGMDISATGDIYITGGYSDATGAFSSLSGTTDGYYVGKVDSSGNNFQILHSMTGDGSDSGYKSNWGSDVLLTSDGGYITTGQFYANTGDFMGLKITGVAETCDVFVAKYNSSNVLEWFDTFGSDEHDLSESVYETSEGDFIVTGRYDVNNNDFAGLTTPGLDIFMVKYTSDGTRGPIKSVGGNNYELGTGLTPASNGGYYMTGYTYSNDGEFSKYHGDADGFVIKINEDLDTEWVQIIGGSEFDYTTTVTEIGNGNLIVTGATKSTDGDFTGVELNGEHDAFIIEFDPYFE